MLGRESGHGGQGARGLARALNHPCRLRIFEMHKRQPGRCFSVEGLTAALAQTPEYRDVTAPTVSYHLARLRDARLLPES